MNPKNLLTLTLMGTVFAALGALADSGVFPLPWIAIAALFFAASLVPGLPRIPRPVWTVASLFMILVFFQEVVLNEQPIMGAVKVLIYVGVNRAFDLKGPAEHFQLVLCGFLCMLAAAAYSLTFTFAVFFFVYMVFGASFMVAIHFSVEESRKDENRGWICGQGLPTLAPMGRIVISGLVITLASAALLFLLLPRVGIGRLKRARQDVPHYSGFSTEVDLDDISSIRSDRRVVMRIRPSCPPEDLPPVLYVRGVAFSTYEGRSWNRDSRSRPVQIVAETPFQFSDESRTRRLVHFDYTLEPLLNSVVFSVDRPHSLTPAPDSGLVVDQEGSYFFDMPPARRVRYASLSDPGLPPGKLTADSQAPYPAEYESYLEVPDLPPRIAALTAQITKGHSARFDKARSLQAHLRKNYAYSVDIKREKSADPLEEFLFDRRSGHCEYFATALAVMLRQAGIPSRLVSGFATWEYNSYDDYFVVRQSDAHSWVEAYFLDRGWIRFDATPSAASSGRSTGALRTLAGMLDAKRFQWDRYVIGFSREDQVAALRFLKHKSQDYSAFARALAASLQPLANKAITAFSWGEIAPYAPLLAMICVVVLTGALYRLSARGSRRSHAEEAGRWYQGMERILRSKGLERPPEETPAEFAARVGDAFSPVIPITELYNRLRFGRRTIRTEDRAKARILLRSLKKAKAPTPAIPVD